MMLSPLPIQKFFDNFGRPMVFGRLFTYVAGTTTKLVTYQDPAGLTPNSNPIVLNFRGEAEIWLDPSLSYKYVLTPPGIDDPPTNPVWTVDGISYLNLISIFTQQVLGQIIYPRTAAEIAAGVTPTFFIYPEGNVLRYGADPLGLASSTVAFQAALNVGAPILIPEGIFNVAALSYSGKVNMRGLGSESVVRCDSTLMTITNGDYSTFEEFQVENITAPLTIQRIVETTVTTTASTTNGSTAITVASATGLRVGMQCFASPVWSGSIVVSIVGTTVTLNNACNATVGSTAVEFYDITFNEGAAAIATLAQSNAEGRYTPNVNDVDVWPTLSPAQQAQAQIGPRILITGNHMRVSRLTARCLSLFVLNSNHCLVEGCDFRGGWDLSAISFDVNNGVRTRNNKAIGNRVRDHGFNGISARACDGLQFADNSAFGVGESGFKLFFGLTYRDGCASFVSTNNIATACYQGAFDYQNEFPNVGRSTLNSQSIGDYAQWCPFGAFGFGGSGWTINVTAAYCPGPAIFAQVSDSRVSGTFIECMYQNRNAGITNNCAVSGPNNLIDGMRIRQDTGRWNATTGFQLVVGGGVTTQTTTLVTNVDLRDGVTALTGAIQANNMVKFVPNTVRTNGTPWDILDQGFTFNITNNAGTLQHAFYAQSGALSLGNFIEKINGATFNNTNTPNGNDATTAMAAGGKIGSASTNVFWFDTAAQVVADALFEAVVIFNNTATAGILVRPQIASININGVTQNRLCFDFRTAAGAAHALTVGNIGAGTTIQVQFVGRLT